MLQVTAFNISKKLFRNYLIFDYLNKIYQRLILIPKIPVSNILIMYLIQ